MSTDSGASGSASAETGPGELSDNVVESVKVQKNGGTYHVSIPIQVAREFDLEKGDQVVFTGQQGDESVRFQTPTPSMFQND